MERYDVNEVLNRSPLKDVARRLGMELERKGKDVRALCPFHQDTQPSLILYQADSNSPEHFHCFSCGAHGTAIDLVKRREGLEFLPAIEWLARNFGIAPNSINSRQKKSLRTSGVSVGTKEAAIQFALAAFDQAHDGVKFNDWCNARKFEPNFLYSRGLRYIRNEVLTRALQKKSRGQQTELLDGLEALGLVRRLRTAASPAQGKLRFAEQFRDYFYDGRVIIPIRAVTNGKIDIVGFAGRSTEQLPREGTAKYLLTPGFDKSNYLYNADQTLIKVEKSLSNGNPETIYLVEGFMDALRLASFGLNSVALMGVSLSNPQQEILKKFALSSPGSGELRYNIFLDSDAAGFGGANRLARRLMDLRGVDLRWTGVPWRTEPGLGKDPDTSLQGIGTADQAKEWLARFELPVEAAILAIELGSQDASEIQPSRWELLTETVRERATFRAALAIKHLYGNRFLESQLRRLSDCNLAWANELVATLNGPKEGGHANQRSNYLNDVHPRSALARRLAYHGSRRGELPCDEETWQTLNSNEYLFDETALKRLQAVSDGGRWHHAAPYDAVNLPRKITADISALADPRLKVMPHPADLHAQQVLLNELLSERHDRLSSTGQVFSGLIPAVRWYGSRQEVRVTGPYPELNTCDPEWNEPSTLSFGYQIDMDVLEGEKTPSDQGMFRPFGQCWRDFMASLASQCRSIGPKVHVLRLDARRYYDSIQRYVLREQLINPLAAALHAYNPSGFKDVLNIDASSADIEGVLDRLLSSLVFNYEYHNPDTEESTKVSESAKGIPQGPVISAYIGTIALFPVDDLARKFIRRTRITENDTEEKPRPRAGYARYVDDIVIFADSEELLKAFREELQAKASESSVSLIHKGERVRSGTPAQVIRQLNDGRGLAASVPAWDSPIVGDGEADWSLGDDLPKVDRQCALQMLRNPSLMDRPEHIVAHVKSAMTAPDLRPTDLGLCARWLWWHVAATKRIDSPDDTWAQFWTAWLEACDGQNWANEFAKRGLDILFAVEGLDRLLDPNPWQSNGQFLSEAEASRASRRNLSKVVVEREFFQRQSPSSNFSHIARRMNLVTRKAWRLLGETSTETIAPPHATRRVNGIEWLCLAARALESSDSPAPLAPLQYRQHVAYPELDLVNRVVSQLKPNPEEPQDAFNRGLAIDFIIRSAPPRKQLETLAKFPNLISSTDHSPARQLIPYLPILNSEQHHLFEIDKESHPKARYIYRCSLAEGPTSFDNDTNDFAAVKLYGEPESSAYGENVLFERVPNDATTIVVDASKSSYEWRHATRASLKSLEPRPQLAARLFVKILAMHQLDPAEGSDLTYVPFLPQIFLGGTGPDTTLHLVANPVPRNLLGVSAWYHDEDDRVQSENVPLSGAYLWRVGWAVADLLGVATQMSGESGEREELLSDEREFDGDDSSDQALEDYVVRQQLRKLQGSQLAASQLNYADFDHKSLPGTVSRALTLLRQFPSSGGRDAQARHVLLIEAESRAMSMRINSHAGGDLRHTMHRVFPDSIARLPLWALEGIQLQRPDGLPKGLRPEVSLLLSLYESVYSVSSSEKGSAAPPLQVALALTAVGVGLRGSVAALWGYASNFGAQRIDDRLNLPDSWVTGEMERLNPEGDYQAMRKLLLDGAWSELSKASPWQWMLALVGLLNASFPQGFDIPALQTLYQLIAEWQTNSSEGETPQSPEHQWPFETVPEFKLAQCQAMITSLKSTLIELDRTRGMRTVCVRGPLFGRSRHTNEFTDVSGAQWQMTTPQYTSLYTNQIEEYRPLVGNGVLKVWTETRSLADNSLLSVHMLDNKLGKWLPSCFSEEETATRDTGAGDYERDAATDLKAGAQRHRTAIKVMPEDNIREDDQLSVDSLIGASDSSLHIAEAAPDLHEDSARMARTDMSSDSRIDLPETFEPSQIENGEVSARSVQAIRGEGKPLEQRLNSRHLPSLLKRLTYWQKASWAERLGGDTIAGQGSRVSPHLRVAVFQHRVDDSYSHPIAETGLAGLPIAKSFQSALQSHITHGSTLHRWSKANSRLSEFRWTDDESLVSWPEHRRRVILREALRACQGLKVQLLILPEVSVRPDTVNWLKDQLRNHPGLSILAGTYRNFEAIDNPDHLTEKLTLLWKPEISSESLFGRDPDAPAIDFRRDKKYRAVAAHEFFRPYGRALHPLYTDDAAIRKIHALRSHSKKGDWSAEHSFALIDELIHGPQKLRYCMELICSELFMLTSPANQPPLRQELAKMLQAFGGDPSEARQMVQDDVTEIAELLTFSQKNRERRSVLLVPAFTSRTNDYWHAGQASVLASGTATVFCNAANQKLSAGGSCFIGIDSVSGGKSDYTGMVHLLTPYHGWSNGILRTDCKGALTPADQALVVVDMDPVNVVSGKPRPQLLPEPMTLVAYLPLVEVIDKSRNATGLVDSMGADLTLSGLAKLQDVLTDEAFPEACGQLHTAGEFSEAFEKLLASKADGSISADSGGTTIEVFKEFFGDPRAIRDRLFAWLKDRHQQPAPKSGELGLEPAWLDFLVADLTWDYEAEYHPRIRVPPWSATPDE